MHVKAKAEIKRYYEQNKAGGPSLKECLRGTVGEKYWKIAVDNLRAIQQHEKKKKQVQQQSQEEVAKLRELKDEEIAKLKASKDEEIAKLRALKDEEIASLVGAVGLAVSQEEEIEEKDKEIATLKESLKRRESDLLKQYMTSGIVLEEKEKRLVKVKQEQVETLADLASKDQQLKSALDGIAKRDEDIAKKNLQLEQFDSIKRILNPVSDDEGESANKRARTSTSDTSMEIWDKDPPRMMTRHQNQILNRASEKPIVKLENKVEGFKRCPFFPECNTIGLFTKGCSIVTCRMNMRHNGKFHHFCFYCGKTARDPGDSCNNGICPYKIDEESRKLYQDNLDKAFIEFSRQTRQAGGAYDVDKV